MTASVHLLLAQNYEQNLSKLYFHFLHSIHREHCLLVLLISLLLLSFVKYF